MTDLTLICNELKSIAALDSSELEKYKSCAESAAAYVAALLKDAEHENDSRIVHLCAVRALYQITLLKDFGDDVTSFKAGDVSYTKGGSCIAQARELLAQAVLECGTLIRCTGFAFEAV